jgi:hypothetical protein
VCVKIPASEDADIYRPYMLIGSLLGDLMTRFQINIFYVESNEILKEEVVVYFMLLSQYLVGETEKNHEERQPE